MPFKTVKELPPNIKKLNPFQQRQWMQVFNSSFSKARKEGKSVKQAEIVAFKSANGVLKNTKAKKKK